MRRFVIYEKNWNYYLKLGKFKQFTFLKDNYIMDKSRFSVGDIVCEKHYPRRIGVVLEVYRHAVLVHWKNPRPSKMRAAATMEVIDPNYLGMVEGEEI